MISFVRVSNIRSIQVVFLQFSRFRLERGSRSRCAVEKSSWKASEVSFVFPFKVWFAENFSQ